MFYKSKEGDRYVYLKSVMETIVVHLAYPFTIDIQTERTMTATEIEFFPEHFEKITHSQFYSVLFEAIEHLKEFLPEKNNNIFDHHNPNTDFTQDHDYEDENTDKEWWSHRRVVE